MAKANDVPQFGLLNGLKVLSCGQVTAEPHATSLMAEHGADVIHVENCKSPEMTRGFAISFAQENRNKRNLAMTRSWWLFTFPVTVISVIRITCRVPAWT